MSKFRPERSEKGDRGERTPRFSRDSAPRFSRGSGSRRENRFRNDDRPRRDRPRSEGRPEMHSVVCDKCGSRCEVPFMPTGDKPVYCSDCFRKTDSNRGDGNRRERSRDSGPGNFSAELQQINKKLDRIIEALELE